MSIERKCSTCAQFDGEPGDGSQFCDEKEIYVHEDGNCFRWTPKEATPCT